MANGNALPGVSATRYGRAALTSEVDRLESGSATGSRHFSVHQSAFRMGQLVAAGELDEARAEASLIHSALALGLPWSDATRQVERGLAKGADHPRGPAKDGTMLRGHVEACLRVADLWEHVGEGEWAGAKGATDLRLFAAFCLVAMRVGKVRLSLSMRQWAEEAGMNHSTVVRRVPELSPWIVRVKRGNRFTAATSIWQLGTPEKRGLSTRPEATPTGTARMVRDPRLPPAGSIHAPSADHFHRRHGAWVIVNLLDPYSCDVCELTVPMIVIATGLHASTVRANLHYLAGLGLVERIDRFTWRGQPFTTEDLSLTPDYGAQRKARHEAERQAYKRRFVDPETGEILRRVTRYPTRVRVDA